MEGSIPQISPTPEPMGDQIEKKENFAKDAWFDAFYKGNSLIPQTATGFATYLRNALVLDEASVNWAEFLGSKLSSKHIETLGRAMSAMHARKDVQVSAEGSSHLFKTQPMIVPPERLQALWNNAKVSAIQNILLYISEAHRPVNLEFFLNQGNTESVPKFAAILEDYFNDPDQKKDRDQLKASLQVIREGLGDPAIKDLIADYRSQFKQGADREKLKTLWKDEYYTRYMKIMEDKLLNRFDNDHLTLMVVRPLI